MTVNHLTRRTSASGRQGVVGTFVIGLTDHLEGPLDQPSAAIFEEVADLVRVADELGVKYAWFSEHHAHAHFGHLPTPLLFALHMAGRTQQIHLGTAIICLNLHHPLDVAEQVAVADVLTKGRMVAGFGSGSTPEEFHLFGLTETDSDERHRRFGEALELISSIWSRCGTSHRVVASEPVPYFSVPPHNSLPVPSKDLLRRSWVAVNSVGSAKIAGRLNYNILFSHLRTPVQYKQYRIAYRGAGGTGMIAANRPIFVGPDDESAFAQAEPALRNLWRRFRHEGKIPSDMVEPDRPQDLCAHPINFIVGGPRSVAQQLLTLYEQSPFDVVNVEVRWAGLSHEFVRKSLQRLMKEVVPMLERDALGTKSIGPIQQTPVASIS
jgi:alkanesulfonate monooxygenase SsuD/methylene tetrahydromethanopterin reductase-like flavin-dependent oxidoreductase (luciferase family)